MSFEKERDNIRGAVAGCRIAEILYNVNVALESGMPAADIVNALNEGMTDVGFLFERGRLFLPHVLCASAGIKKAVEMMKDDLGYDVKNLGNMRGTVAIGTVSGDIHDIGKSICTTMLQCAGFNVVDLGVDVSSEAFLERISEGSQFIAMSAILTSTMPAMKDVIDLIEAEGLRDKVVILIGGAPVTQSFADKIGADIYGETASETMEKTSKCLELITSKDGKPFNRLEAQRILRSNS